MRPLYALMALSTLSLKIGLRSLKHLLLSFFLSSLCLCPPSSDPLFYLCSSSRLFFHRSGRSRISFSSPSYIFSVPFFFFATFRGSCRSPGYSSMSVIFVAGFSFLFVRRGPFRARWKLFPPVFRAGISPSSTRNSDGRIAALNREYPCRPNCTLLFVENIRFWR